MECVAHHWTERPMHTTSTTTFFSSVPPLDVEEKTVIPWEESHTVPVDLQIARKESSDNEHSTVGIQGKGFWKGYLQVNPN